MVHNGTLGEKDIVGQLKKCEEEIEHLERRLAERQAQKAQLEAHLLAHRAVTAPIKHVPQEVLILIFLEVIAESPMAVGRLLFVCRAWYQLVTNQPTLWSRIESYLTGNPRDIKRLTQYLTCALRYSATSPLKLTLDMHKIKATNYWDYLVADVIDRQGDSASHEWGVDSIRSRVCKWSRDQDRGRRCGFPPMEDYLSAVWNFMKVLTGANGEEMRRWLSLSLSSSWWSFQEREWGLMKLLLHPMPLLKFLSIKMDGEVLDCPPIQIVGSPHLTTVVMRGEHIPILCTAQVTTLTFDVCEGHQLVYSTHFANVRTLRIYFYNRTRFDEPLHLPQLRCMTIEGSPNLHLLDLLDAPLLHTLCFWVPYTAFLGIHRSQVFSLPSIRFFLLEDVPDVPTRYEVDSWFSPVPSVGLSHQQPDILREQVRAWRRRFPDIRGYLRREGEWDFGDLQELVVD